MREGNIIIGVDNCQGHFRTFKKKLVGTSQDHGTMTTNAAGTEFTVCVMKPVQFQRLLLPFL